MMQLVLAVATGATLLGLGLAQPAPASHIGLDAAGNLHINSTATTIAFVDGVNVVALKATSERQGQEIIELRAQLQAVVNSLTLAPSAASENPTGAPTATPSVTPTATPTASPMPLGVGAALQTNREVTLPGGWKVRCAEFDSSNWCKGPQMYFPVGNPNPGQSSACPVGGGSTVGWMNINHANEIDLIDGCDMFCKLCTGTTHNAFGGASFESGGPFRTGGPHTNPNRRAMFFRQGRGGVSNDRKIHQWAEECRLQIPVLGAAAETRVISWEHHNYQNSKCRCNWV